MEATLDKLLGRLTDPVHVVFMGVIVILLILILRQHKLIVYLVDMLAKTSKVGSDLTEILRGMVKYNQKPRDGD